MKLSNFIQNHSKAKGSNRRTATVFSGGGQRRLFYVGNIL
jgi:hypothetical protein